MNCAKVNCKHEAAFGQSLCACHVRVYNDDPAVRALTDEMRLRERELEIYRVALAGPAANTPATLEALHALIKVERALRETNTAWLARGDERQALLS